MRPSLFITLIFLTACTYRSGLSPIDEGLAQPSGLDDVPTPISADALDGLVVWLDASRTDATPEGVERWTDQSGNQLDALQPDSARRPTLVADAMNGEPALRFDAFRGCSLRIPEVSAGEFTMVIVFRSSRPGILYEHGIGNWLQSGTGFSSSVSHFGDRTAGDLARGWGEEDVPRVVVQRFDGSHVGHGVRLDGREREIDAVEFGNPGTAIWSAPLDIGSRNDGESWLVHGDIAQVILYNRSLSLDETRSLECELGRRYNINVDGCGFALPTVTAVEPSAAAAVPNDGLALWLRARDLTWLEHGDGTPVGYWPDASGRERHAAQSHPDRRAVLRNDGIHGVPAVEFDGMGDRLIVDDLVLSRFTIFTVFAAPRSGMLYEHRDGHWLLTDAGLTARTARSALTSEWDVPAWGIDGQPHLATHIFDGTHAGHSLVVDGQTLSRNDGNTDDPGIASHRGIFSVGGRRSGYHFQGRLAELIVFDRVLDVAELSAVRSYLRETFALDPADPSSPADSGGF